MKTNEKQLEIPLPELERPRWFVRGYFDEGERISAPFDDKKDAEIFKIELEKVCSTVKAHFKVEKEK